MLPLFCCKFCLLPQCLDAFSLILRKNRFFVEWEGITKNLRLECRGKFWWKARIQRLSKTYSNFIFRTTKIFQGAIEINDQQPHEDTFRACCLLLLFIFCTNVLCGFFFFSLKFFLLSQFSRISPSKTETKSQFYVETDL